MTFIPHTDEERRAMLAAIGVDSLEALFDAVSADMRFPTLRCRHRYRNSNSTGRYATAPRATAWRWRVAHSWARAAIATSFPRRSTACSSGASSTPPTRPISPS